MKRRIIPIGVCSVFLLIIGIINIEFNFIMDPSSEDIIQRQVDYITISTVFMGFSFTALGILLGLSSEELIRKISDTSIVMKKVEKTVSSIVFFVLSVLVSLFFVLGLDIALIKSEGMRTIIDRVLYVFSIGYLLVGIFYFICSVYAVYDLVKRVYAYNKRDMSKKISISREQMEKTRNKMRENEIQDNNEE